MRSRIIFKHHKGNLRRERGAMCRIQRNILLVGLCLFLLAGLFPPWVVRHHSVSRDTSTFLKMTGIYIPPPISASFSKNELSIGPRFIIPAHRASSSDIYRWLSVYEPNSKHYPTEMFADIFYCKIDVTTLAITWIIIVVLTLGLMVYFSPNKWSSKSTSS